MLYRNCEGLKERICEIVFVIGFLGVVKVYRDSLVCEGFYCDVWWFLFNFSIIW